MKLPITLWLVFITTVSVSTFSRFFSLKHYYFYPSPSIDHRHTSLPKPVRTIVRLPTTTTTTTTANTFHNNADSSSTHKDPLQGIPLYDYQVCTSPEDHVEWPLAGPVRSHSSSAITCGLESDSSPFSLFLKHNVTLPVHMEQECSRLVVYGVAFGEAHVKSLSTIHTKVLDSRQLLALHNRCFFMFVLEEDMPHNNQQQNQNNGNNNKNRHHAASVMVGHTWLIPIPRNILPYGNLRRNVKLLKYNGHFLFPQAQAVIWQDAKFFQRVNVHKQPNNYFRLIPTTRADGDNNDDSSSSSKGGACLQVMGLPVHPNVFGLDNLMTAINANKTYQPAYLHHCQTILDSLAKRPDVTDSASNLMQQCYSYLQHVVAEEQEQQQQQTRLDAATNVGDYYHHSSSSSSSSHSRSSIMNHGLLDSAFLVWNQSTESCRAFNAALQCTVTDQLQCHSDRDQVSLPFAFYKMGLQVKQQQQQQRNGSVKNNSGSSRGGDVVVDNDDDVVIDGRRQDLEFVIAKNRFSQPSSNADDDDHSNSDPVMVRMTRSSCHWYFSRLGDCPEQDQPSLAVMVAGGATRFMFNSTVEHLLKPLVQQQGYQVDYYAVLTVQKAQAYRQDSSYMDHITYDPIFSRSFKNTKRGKDATEVMKGIRDTMRDAIEDAGAYLAGLKLRGKTLEVDSPALRRKHLLARRLHRKEDVDLRFPTLDLRPNARKRTAVGNRNMLRLFYGLEFLWDSKLVLFENVVGKQYDYVMILRDDTLWLDDFDMKALIATNPEADAYILSCDDRDPPMMSQELNDHGIIVKREKAEIFGKYFSSLLNSDLEGCHAAVTGVLGSERGCNSEMILNWIVKQHQVTIQLVPQSLFPFERAVTVRQSDGTTQQCFHKFCQSKEAPLWIDPNMMMCSELKFD